jgi:hypothetical protein
MFRLESKQAHDFITSFNIQLIELRTKAGPCMVCDVSDIALASYGYRFLDSVNTPRGKGRVIGTGNPLTEDVFPAAGRTSALYCPVTRQ